MHCPFCNNSVIIPPELRQPGVLPNLRSGNSTAVTDSRLQTADQINEIARLVQHGDKIGAIKLYRQITGVGLVEAKTAVEAIQAGSPAQIDSASSLAQPSSSMDGLSPDQIAQILRLVSSGQKIEAIKLYRSLRPVGLVEAKAAVESISPDAQQTAASGVNKKFNFALFGAGLVFLGIASIFPLVFIPMGIASLQQNDIGGAVGSFIGAGVWALAWGAIGAALIYWSFAKV
jgi:ribosomal protein L7/L12